jgi:hypothetical protein
MTIVYPFVAKDLLLFHCMEAWLAYKDRSNPCQWVRRYGGTFYGECALSRSGVVSFASFSVSPMG